MDRSFTIWFTGLPRAGKATVASLVAKELRELGCKVEVLDSDVVRPYIMKSLPFSREGMDTYNRIIGFACQLLNRNGIVAIAAGGSIYRAHRRVVRQSIGRFVEVYLKCPVKVHVIRNFFRHIRQRDLKGIYDKIRRGDIKTLVTFIVRYEKPLQPDVICDTVIESPEESAYKVIQRLTELRYLPEAEVVEKPGEIVPAIEAYLQREMG